MIPDLAFRKLDRVRRRLVLHAAELGYVCLDEVLHRHKCVQLARIGFSPEDLADQLVDDDEIDDEAEETATLGSLEEDEEDISDEPTVEGAPDQHSGLAEATGADETQQLCDAVIAWIQEEVNRVMAGRPNGTFKLMLYRPKGGYIASQTFGVFNHAYQPPRPPPPEPPPEPAPAPAPAPPAPPQQLPALAAPPPPVVVHPPPVQVVVPPPEPAPRSTPAVAVALNGGAQGQLIYLDPDTIPEARVWRALGQATEDFLGRVGAAYGNIIDLQSRTVHHQSAQLDKSQALVESLATQLLAARRLQAGDEADQKADERQIRVREELGKTFLNELGSLGRVLASSKLGMSPELAELGDLIATSPELTEALRDPSVRALLKEDATRKELAKLLTLAAKQPKPSGESTPPQAA